MDFEISAGQVKAMLKRGEKFTLLDVREPWEWEKSRIEGSKQMPMGDVPTRAHEELDSDEHIVVVPSRRAFPECHQLAAPAGIRKRAVDAWWYRRLGAHGGPEGAAVLKEAIRHQLSAFSKREGWGDRELMAES